MIVRRVITGHDQAGQAVFLSDGPPPRAKAFTHTRGFVSCPVWSTGPEHKGTEAPGDDPTATTQSMHAEPGGSVLLVITFPPDSVMADDAFDFAAAWPEHLEELPGIAESFDPEAPGMHRTDTLDYAIVLAGEIWLELANGAERHLKPHDIVVQQGTRHAWRNKSALPATLAFCMLGQARRR